MTVRTTDVTSSWDVATTRAFKFDIEGTRIGESGRSATTRPDGPPIDNKTMHMPATDLEALFTAGNVFAQLLDSQ